MIIQLPHCYPVLLDANLSHWHRNGTRHGPQSNPRWIYLSLVKLGMTNRPSSGRRLWVYVRGGYAMFFDVYVDRRPLVAV